VDFVDFGDLESEFSRDVSQIDVQAMHALGVGLGEDAHVEFAPALRLTVSNSTM
jgi:hypothetical protein